MAQLQESPAWQAFKATVTAGDNSFLVQSQERLGGVQTKITLPQVNLRYTVSVEVRGKGKVQLGIFGSSAWAYSPDTELELERWKTISLSYYESQSFFNLSLYASKNIGAEFEFRDFKLTSSAKPDWPAVAIDRIDFEAEDYPGSNGKIQKMAETSGGQAIGGGRWYQVTRLPVPASSAPLFFYCRSKKDSDVPMQLNVVFEHQRLSSADIVQAYQWQWLKIGPVPAAALHPNADLNLSGEENCQAWVDRVIISSNPDLQNLDAKVASDSSSKGMLSIARTSQAPTMDGKLDDNSWKSAIEIGPFILNRQNNFAREQTRVRFLYDDRMLYVAFHCQTSCLVPAANRLHEFKNNLRENDSEKIWQEDCVLLLLWPDAKQKTAYDFIINPAGFLCDSILTAPDIWSQRDSTWNSEAQVVTSVDDGAWNVEMAIPLKKLALTPGLESKFMVGRIEKSSQENSAWQLLSKGFHVLEDFSELRLLENLPGCEIRTLPEFSPGANVLEFAASEPLHFQAKLKFESSPWQRFWNDSKNKGQFNISQNGKFQFQWSLAPADQLSPFLISPIYTLSAQSMALNYQLSSGELWLNNRQVQSGAALNTGLNKLEIRVTGDVSGTFQVADEQFSVDSLWSAQDNARQLNLLVEDSKIWPEWRREGLFINKDGIQQILFVPQGVEGYVLEDYTVYWEMPASFSLVGVSGYYKLYQLEVLAAETFERNQQKYIRYPIRFKNQMLSNRKLKTHQLLAIIVKAPEKSATNHCQFYFHAGSKQAAIREIPQVLPVTLLPALQGKQPEKLMVQMWTSWLSSMDDKVLSQQLAYQMKTMGVTEAGFYSKSILKRFCLLNFASWNFDCQPYLAKYPDCALIDKNGKKSKQFICSTALLQQGAFKQYFRERLPAWMERWNQPSHVNWDYESRVMDSYISCFCPLCMQDFKKQNPDIKAELTPELIQKQYYQQWTIFMDQRMAALAGLFRDVLHEYQPDLVFSVYSGYQSETTKHFYGVDWSLLKNKIDLGKCGYGRPVEEIEATRQALGDTPLVLGAIVHPYNIESRNSPSWLSRAKLMRRASDASGGILIYEYPILDGRSFDAISQVSQFMSQYEEFFRRHDV
ncbi:MAG: hypothetical protein WCT05_01310, partial [Lentisphaeria bacterium]